MLEFSLNVIFRFFSFSFFKSVYRKERMGEVTLRAEGAAEENKGAETEHETNLQK